MDSVTVIKALLLIATVGFNLVLAVVVYLNNPRSATNRVYSSLSAVISVWLVANYVSLLPLVQHDSLLWIRLSIFFAAPMLGLLVLFAYTVPSSRYPITIRQLAGYGLMTAGVMMVCVSPYAFTQVTIVDNVPQPTVGPGIAVFMLAAIVALVTAVALLVQKFRHSTGAGREVFRYVMIGIGAMISLLIGTVLIPVVVWKTSFFVSFIPLYVSIFLGLTTYAIVRHRLFDIRAIVARSAAYLLIVGTITLVYTAGLYVVTNLLFADADVNLVQTAVYIGLAIVIAFTLPPLHRFFARATDRVFYSDNYDAQSLLDRVSGILASQLELQPLLNKFLSELIGTMHLSFARMVVMDGSQVFDQAARGRAAGEPLNHTELGWFDHPLIIFDELAGGTLKTNLEGRRIRVVLQLRAHGELVGYLVLGDKLSGAVYSDQDLAVLEIMRKEVAVAVANAKAYDEIAQFNVTLQERIRVATRRLQAANTNLRALDKTKDEFISMASHQLGTPLTAITGYLAMTLDNDDHNMTADQREFVGYALEAAEKMVYMAGDMLNVSRLNSGRFMIQRQPTELVKIIKQEIHQLEPAAQRKGLKLTAELPEHPVSAELDESKTRQVIMNFIDNALYYTETGGVHVKLEELPGKVKLTVTDTGIGVPAAEQAKLFAKFYRAGNAKAVRPDGTGLGLYLAKRVVEDQGGQLIFASQEGKGSTFGFVLPV